MCMEGPYSMSLMKRAGLKTLAFALILILCHTRAALAAASTPPPLDAAPYDAEYPENLSADQLYARSVILIDQDTGRVLFEKNADQRMYPASTTKVMTLMLALKYGPMGETVTVPEEAGQVPEGSSMMNVKPGEEVLFDGLLYGLMISSGNDAANAIAVIVSGSVKDFVALMNERAAELNLTNTHFTSAHGYHNDDHYTTVREMAVIARAAMQDPRVSQIASTLSYTLPENNLRKKTLTLKSKTEFLAGMGSEYSYPYATGLKTGKTSKAGQCFVGTAEKDGVKLISVVFQSTVKYEQPRWVDTIRLMDYGYSQYGQFTFPELYALAPLSVEVESFDPDDSQGGALSLKALPGEGADAFTLTGLRDDGENLARSFMSGLQVTYDHDLKAPIRAGDVIGRAWWSSKDGNQLYEAALVAARDVAAAPPDLPLVNDSDVSVIWLLVALIAALILLSVMVSKNRAAARRRRRRAKKRGLMRQRI